MKKKIGIIAILVLCIFGAWKYGLFSNEPSQTVKPPSTQQNTEEYADLETKLEKLDKDQAKQAKNNVAIKKEIEKARKTAQEKEGTFKKIGKGSSYMIEVIENNKKHYYMLHEDLDPAHFIFKDGDPILFSKSYVKSLDTDVIFSISSQR